MSPVAGIVLAGGRSSRMGRPKATLDWHGRPLVDHVVAIVSRAVDGPLVVVRAPGQELPPLTVPALVAEDAREGCGPLEGIAAGLRRLGDRAAAAYVSGVDVPLLHPAFVRRVVSALDTGTDIVVPRTKGLQHPLAAVYRTSLLPTVEELLAEGSSRLSDLFERARTRELDEPALLADPRLAARDPELSSLVNVNRPGDYEDALRADALRGSRRGARETPAA